MLLRGISSTTTSVPGWLLLGLVDLDDNLTRASLVVTNVVSLLIPRGPVDVFVKLVYGFWIDLRPLEFEAPEIAIVLGEPADLALLSKGLLARYGVAIHNYPNPVDSFVLAGDFELKLLSSLANDANAFGSHNVFVDKRLSVDLTKGVKEDQLECTVITKDHLVVVLFN